MRTILNSKEITGKLKIDIKTIAYKLSITKQRCVVVKWILKTKLPAADG